MGISNLCCRDDLIHRGVLHAERYVVEDGIIEEDRFLIDVSDKAAEILDPELPYVGPVKGDGAFAGVVVPWDKVCQC